MSVDAELLEALRGTARRFAEREVVPMVGTDQRDGDLSSVPQLLACARSIGLISWTGADNGDDGVGIWARSSPPDGDVISTALLEEVAVECAGFAACLHHAGLAAMELGDSMPMPHAGLAVALFDRSWRPDWPALITPPDGAATLRDGRLNGTVSFVHAPPGYSAFVVYAAGLAGWERALVMRDAPGLVCDDVGPRTGLAAVEMEQLSFANVHVPASQHLAPAAPLDYVRRLCLGLSAIALGNARGALRAADRYAQERRQGGAAIERYAAVRMLLGESRSRIASASAHLLAACATGPGAAWRAAAAKLQITSQCHRAVSDCMQVLGGYGFIQDYRLEKRLRDAMTLLCGAIDPNTLRLMCASVPEGI